MVEKDVTEHYNQAWAEDFIPPYVLSLYAPLKKIGISKNTKVLDLGCGNGAIGEWLRKNFACQVWGTEISDVAAVQATQKGYTQVVCHSLEDERPPFPGQKFNIVLLCATLEHLFTPEKALQQARTSLKEDGILLVLTPNVCWIRNRFLFLLGFWQHKLLGGTRGHIHYFNKIQLKQLLEEKGFGQLDWSYSALFVVSPKRRIGILRLLIGKRVRWWQGLWAENFIVIAKKAEKTKENRDYAEI